VTGSERGRKTSLKANKHGHARLFQKNFVEILREADSRNLRTGDLDAGVGGQATPPIGPRPGTQNDLRVDFCGRSRRAELRNSPDSLPAPTVSNWVSKVPTRMAGVCRNQARRFLKLNWCPQKTDSKTCCG